MNWTRCYLNLIIWSCFCLVQSISSFRRSLNQLPLVAFPSILNSDATNTSTKKPNEAIALSPPPSGPSSRYRLLSGVMLTTGKDTRVFEKSIESAMKHLIDVDDYYIITPEPDYLNEKFGKILGSRVKFVDEAVFPFKYDNISEVMIEAVKEKGVYPLTGHSSFERTVGGRVGWFLQQLLKLYAGQVLKLEDFVLLDSDIVWFRDVSFYNNTNREEILNYQKGIKIPPNNFQIRFNYASSGQYHSAYMATMKKIIGLEPYEDPKDCFRSGIVHHMVIAGRVMNQLMIDSQELHGGLPFWKILLNQSAIEMTCRAPKDGICGAGSTLSEYEMYFTYARHKFPETVAFRALLWANGPMPGLLFWPPIEPGKMHADRHRGNWLGHRQADVMKAFERQLTSDRAQGYDYVGYHSYAKRRYYEMVQPDYLQLCANVPLPVNTTCSWKGFDERIDQSRTMEDWFKNCGCYMLGHD